MVTKNGIDWTELGFVVYGKCPEYKKYKIDSSGKNVAFKKSYRDWNRIKSHTNICEEWLVYDDFNKWFNENYYSVDGEKMMLSYRFWNLKNHRIVPEECIYLPRKIYYAMQIYNKSDETLPRGIYKQKNLKYEVRLIENNKPYYTKIFKTKEEALSAYENKKREKLIEIAENYKGTVPQKVINRLLNFRLE